MNAETGELKVPLARIEQVDFTPHAEKLWSDRRFMDISASCLYSRFQEIEQTLDILYTAGRLPTLDNINETLKNQCYQSLLPGDIKLLCILAPWLYKLHEEIVLGKKRLLLSPLVPVNPVTKEWLITTRRMIMFTAIVNWFKREQVPKVHPESMDEPINLKKCSPDALPLPPYVSDSLWKAVVRKLEGGPVLLPSKKKRGRPPVHGYYCKVPPTLDDPLEVDKLAITPRVIPSERELALSMVRTANKDCQKRIRERKIRQLKAEGNYRKPGRPITKFSTFRKSLKRNFDRFN